MFYRSIITYIILDMWLLGELANTKITSRPAQNKYERINFDVL